MKASSINSEIKKINFNANFNAKYQEYGKVIFIESVLDYEIPHSSEISDEKKNLLIAEGIANDERLVQNIEYNESLFKTCKKFGIEVVNIKASAIYSYETQLMESEVLKVFKVGKYHLENYN